MKAGEYVLNVAVVGSSGYIAGYILERLNAENCIKKVLKIGRSLDADIFLDLSNAQNFDYNALEGIEYIIFTAAISAPDECADNFNKCWVVNVDGTSFFINQAIKRQCKVIFFSSDAVFGDSQSLVYNECSITQATKPYGRMKKAVEDEFGSLPYFKALRLPYVVSACDRFITYCLNCMQTNKVAEIYHPFYRNCVMVNDVVNATIWLLQNWSNFKERFLNVAGDELISRIRLVDEINRLFKQKLKYKIINPGDNFFKNRVQITQMSSLYLYQYGILQRETFTAKFQREFKLTIGGMLL